MKTPFSCVSTLAFAVLFGIGLLPWTPPAQAEPVWETAADVDVAASAPIRSRRSPDARVEITMTNNGVAPVEGPARLVLELSGAVRGIAGATENVDGNWVLDVSPQFDPNLGAGAGAQIEVTVQGGGRRSFGLAGVVEVQVEQPPPPGDLSVQITAPESLITVGSSPITVSGLAAPAGVPLTVNGIDTSSSGGSFSTDVALTEGLNTIVARVVGAGGEQLTDTISVTLDLTPPTISIDSHESGEVVSVAAVTITGAVSDMIRGTVGEDDSNVTVNGVAATVKNRSYSAPNVPLVEGANAITAVATDAVGNTKSTSITLVYEVPVGPELVLVSGDGQTAPITNNAPDPLVVRLLDGTDTPVADEPVIFRVIQGSGKVAANTPNEGRAVVVQTDAQGLAQTAFELGQRVGVSNHKVRAAVVGVGNDVVFSASGEGLPGDKISVASGNNQRGAVGQVLPEPLVAVVTDAGNNVVEGAAVLFEARVGGGLFENDLPAVQLLTDADGRVAAEFWLGDLAGIDAQRVRATLVGTSASAGFSASGFVPADAGDTAISGIVLDNQDNPVEGVTVRVDGTSRSAVVDAAGLFTIAQAPVGPVHLIADGSTAVDGREYPSLAYDIVTVSGVNNTLPAPIYMVPLNTADSVYAGPEDVVLVLPQYPGFALKIFKDSVTFPDGAREGFVSVTPVNASKVPMPPPNGMQPNFIITVQPAGTQFDPPARLAIPNTEGFLAGAQTEMFSFDHDLGEFVSIGPGTVSDDGTVITSDPGFGVVKAGWHCGSQPNPQGCCSGGGAGGGGCAICKKSESGDCNNNDCVADDSQDPGECKQCQGGSPVPDDSDTPQAECKKCEGGAAVADSAQDGNSCGDGTPQQNCYTCKNGNCGNNCEVVEGIIKTSVSVSPQWGSLAGKLTDAITKIPWLRASLGISFAGEQELGTECCKDCTINGPQPYQKLSGNGKLEGKLEVIIPGTGAIGEEEVEILCLFGTSYQVFAEWKFGVFIDVTVSAGAGIEYKNTACPEPNCFSGNLALGGQLAGGLTGGGKVGYREVDKATERTLYSQGVGAKIEGRAVTDYTVKVTKQFTDGCGPDTCELGWGGVKLEAEISADISIGPISYGFSESLSVVVADPGTEPC